MATAARTKSFVSKPDDYDGSFEHYKRFLNQISLYILANTDNGWFATDTAKVQFALSYMKTDYAAEFAKNFLDKVLKMRNPDFGTWADFKTAMDAAFLDPNTAKNAQWKLHECRQGNKTAAEFFTEFDLLRRAAGYDDTTHHNAYLIQLLEQALNRSIVKTIIGTGDIPDTYEKWRARTLTIDAGQQRIRELNAQSNRGASSSHERTSTGTTSSKTHARSKKNRKGKQRMFIPTPHNPPSGSGGGHQSGKGQTYGGSGQPMEIDRQKSKVTCYFCNKPGHTKSECRAYKRQQSAQAQPVRSQQRTDGLAVVRYTGQQSGSSNQTQNIRALIGNMSMEQRQEAIDELAKGLDA